MSNYRRFRVPGGTYFFTLNLQDRGRTLLVDHVDLLRKSFRQAYVTRPFKVLAVVVLPEHLHCLWRLPAGDVDNANRWAQIKSGFCRQLPDLEKRSSARVARRERGIWQRRFWEHLITDDDDLGHHIDYIHFNPVKHGHASCATAWPYSSVHRYVRAGLLPADWAVLLESAGSTEVPEGGLEPTL